MDKKYISRFFDFFSISILITILTQTDMLYLTHLVFAHLTCFCTSYLFLHILLVFAHLVLHFSLFYYTFYSLFLFFTYIYIYALVWCYFYIILFFALSTERTWFDLHFTFDYTLYNYHVTNKETLTFTVINAFCVNLKRISKGNQLDLSQKVVTCL